LTSEAAREIELEDDVLVTKRIHVSYRLRIDSDADWDSSFVCGRGWAYAASTAFTSAVFGATRGSADSVD
jgi:hypothetical protein